MTNPSVFLSYSHDSTAHKDWVRRLAEDLRHQGVDARLDQWDLRPGADLVAFMAEEIRRADRVLLVCSGTYVRKLEQGEGGAGYEGMIVTSHLASHKARSTDTVKFIPLVRNNPSEPPLPDLLGHRYWLDFRDDALYSERLEELLRELHDRPRFQKPPLGEPAFRSVPAETGRQSPDAAGGPRATLAASRRRARSAGPWQPQRRCGWPRSRWMARPALNHQPLPGPMACAPTPSRWRRPGLGGWRPAGRCSAIGCSSMVPSKTWAAG